MIYNHHEITNMYLLHHFEWIESYDYESSACIQPDCVHEDCWLQVIKEPYWYMHNLVELYLWIGSRTQRRNNERKWAKHYDSVLLSGASRACPSASLAGLYGLCNMAREMVHKQAKSGCAIFQHLLTRLALVLYSIYKRTCINLNYIVLGPSFCKRMNELASELAS